MNKFTSLSILLSIVIVALLAAGGLSQSSDTKIASFNQSMVYESEQNYQKGINELEGLLIRHRNDYLVNLRLGWLHYLNGDQKTSAKYYRNALTVSANRSIEALLGLTLPLSVLGEWDEVAESYRTILLLDPMHYTANLRLAQIFLTRGEYEQAERFFEKLVTHYPGEYEVNMGLGWTSYYKGDGKRAGKMFSTVLMISPGDTLATRGLSLIH